MVNDPTGVFRFCRGLCLESEDSADRYLKFCVLNLKTLRTDI